MEEPTIIVVIKADHREGLHQSEANKYCPLCTEEQIVSEVEAYLKSQKGG